jgi:hypothetical protein
MGEIYLVFFITDIPWNDLNHLQHKFFEAFLPSWLIESINQIQILSFLLKDYLFGEFDRRDLDDHFRINSSESAVVGLLF